MFTWGRGDGKVYNRQQWGEHKDSCKIATDLIKEQVNTLNFVSHDQTRITEQNFGEDLYHYRPIMPNVEEHVQHVEAAVEVAQFLNQIDAVAEAFKDSNGTTPGACFVMRV